MSFIIKFKSQIDRTTPNTKLCQRPARGLHLSTIACHSLVCCATEGDRT
ncbi:hypothetical protein H6S82_08515 [Planktothrix sp. FACHB-1355]|uniref:Uncharacterized protein n=1 Tax=Aerosakkonema funiforme FACHB-1375 TaxID=2949571 RepID=A0A926ZHS3_9CYAN|nr:MULTISPECIES: hypothetical protein [Oscillatoriales]MBD2182934.1 hypothetical protein [Aerosakkonema funiforme FACHB-1375]MBD3558900.1 hypothetical protein [Planktothrix sp. FACHB-1355]